MASLKTRQVASAGAPLKQLEKIGGPSNLDFLFHFWADRYPLQPDTDLFRRLPAAKITQIKESTPAAWAKITGRGSRTG
jgi:hypothetical protein